MCTVALIVLGFLLAAMLTGYTISAECPPHSGVRGRMRHVRRIRCWSISL